MSSNRILRYGALAGVVVLPTMVSKVANAATLSDSTTAAAGPNTAVTVTVILEADLTGSLTLSVSERDGDDELLAGSTGDEHIDFGIVDSDGNKTGEGDAATSSDGAIFYKQLRADVDFAGYQLVTVAIDGSITHSLSGAADNAKAVAACVANGNSGNAGSTANISWGGAGAFTTPTNGLAVGTATSAFNLTCFTAQNTGGARQTIGSNVDLAMFFSDAAPTGSYTATFVFTATATN